MPGTRSENEVIGTDQCAETATRAGHLGVLFGTTRPDRDDGRRYATGFGSAVALAKRVGDSEAMYVVQHGRDQLLQKWESSSMRG